MSETKQILLKFNQLLSDYTENVQTKDNYIKLVQDERLVLRESANNSKNINQFFKNHKEILEILLEFVKDFPELLISIIFQNTSEVDFINLTLWGEEVYSNKINKIEILSPTNKISIFILYDLRSIEFLGLSSYTDAFLHSGVLFSRFRDSKFVVEILNPKIRNRVVKQLGYNINEVLFIAGFIIEE